MTALTTDLAVFTNADQVPADLNDVRDRDGRFWSRDCVNDDPGWFTYPDADLYLSLPDLIGQHGPLTTAVHEYQPPPGPTPGPLPGVCATCGGTGEVHGPGGNGNWLGVACGCETAYCGLCGDPWPCYGSPEVNQP